MKTNKVQTLVTRPEFFKETQSIRKELKEETQSIRNELKTLNNTVNQLDTKVNKIAVALLNTQHDLQTVKETMMTKEDGQRIIEHIDAFAQKYEVYDRKVVVDDERIKVAESTLQNHETSITHLENS